MPAPDFLDTNVVVYAYDISSPHKQRIAQELVTRAVAGEYVVSTQVLAEFAATLLHKIVPPAAASDVTVILDALGPIPLIVPDGDLVRRAVEAHRTYGLHFYDGMIVAAAERAGSGKIWSEDLNADQVYFGVKVLNPFS
ncbi:MAG TPA: PIN domain-containing protein [Dongiaceae bacterium]|nr:PIN domain-containing protein [Dongiaceae bacterium]